MPDAESIQWYAFNQLRVGLRRLSLPRKSVSLLYQFAVGERPAPGFLPLVLAPIARRVGFDTHHARPALKGRLLAVRSVFARRAPAVVTAVLVSHPHVAAVSAGLAESLAEAGKLAGYFTGVAFTPASLPGRVAGLLAARRPVIRQPDPRRASRRSCCTAT